jgi:Flp pilus assembly pilin Flp
VVRVLDEIMARGRPGTANHSLSALKKLMNWALDRGMIEVNPITGLSPPGKKKSRDRVLHDDEVRRLLGAAEAEGYGLIAALIAVVIIGAVTAVGTSLSATFQTVAGSIK